MQIHAKTERSIIFNNCSKTMLLLWNTDVIAVLMKVFIVLKIL